MMADISATTSLEEAYRIAIEIMKTRAVSFYQAFRLLPADRFRGVAAVYAFCRAADDIADQEEAPMRPEETRQRLDQLENVLIRFYEIGKRSRVLATLGTQLPPWWAALEDTIRRFDVPMESFLQQIRGQRFDTEFDEIRNTDDLIEYSRLVAGSVGTMLLPLLADDGADTQNPGWKLACEQLGIGMQITNILRDVGEDLRLRDRVYLPSDMLREFGVSRDMLVALAEQTVHLGPADIPNSFIQLWEHLAAMADPCYQAYEAWLCQFHPACRLSLVAAARIYRAIAEAVRAASHDCFTRRCYTSEEMRDAILLEAAHYIKSHPCT